MSKKRGYVNEKFVELSLSSLYFPEPHDRTITNQLVLTNITDATVAFKIKTTQPKRYTVKPRAGFIGREDNQEIKISMHPLAEGEKIRNDKFLVETAIVSEREQLESKDVLWKQLEAAKEHRVAGNKLPCHHSAQTPDDLMVVVMNDGSAVVSSKGDSNAEHGGNISEEEDVGTYGWMTSRGKDQGEEEQEYAKTKAEQPAMDTKPQEKDLQSEPQSQSQSTPAPAPDVSEETPNPTEPPQQPTMESQGPTEPPQQRNIEEMLQQAQEKLEKVQTENKELNNQLKSRETIIHTLRTTVQSCETKIAEQDKKLKEKDKKLSMRRKTRSSSSSKETQPEETMNIKIIIIAAIIAFIIGKLL